MKTLNVVFEDKEAAQLTKMKGKKPWREFILELAKIKKE